MTGRDVSPDELYKILDKVGLTETDILMSKVSLSKTINTMRGQLVREVMAYLNEDRNTENGNS